jgi:predicted phosphate transport protein (TIGR00153 family)
MKFFPSKINFFELFDKVVDHAEQATGKLVELMENFDDSERIAKEIREVEHQADLVTHDIMRALHQTFITPIDREDIHRLATRLDDVIDLVWSCVDKMVVFRLEKPTRDAVDLARELHDTTRFVKRAFRDLEGKNYEHVKEHCIEINRLENQIDRMYRNALGDLFDEFKDDPAMIIKWKDIYERLEEAADKCEDVANVLEGIVLKHA